MNKCACATLIRQPIKCRLNFSLIGDVRAQAQNGFKWLQMQTPFHCITINVFHQGRNKQTNCREMNSNSSPCLRNQLTQILHQLQFNVNLKQPFCFCSKNSHNLSETSTRLFFHLCFTITQLFMQQDCCARTFTETSVVFCRDIPSNGTPSQENDLAPHAKIVQPI